MKHIVSLGLFVTCLTLQGANFVDSLWQKTQKTLAQGWDVGYKKANEVGDMAYSRMPSQECVIQGCTNTLKWVSKKTPVPVKETANKWYQTGTEKALQGYAWVNEKTPSQEEFEQKSLVAWDVFKNKAQKTQQYIHDRTPENLRRWITKKKVAGSVLSEKIYLNVSVWMAKLVTVIEQINT